MKALSCSCSARAKAKSASCGSSSKPSVAELGRLRDNFDARLKPGGGGGGGVAVDIKSPRLFRLPSRAQHHPGTQSAVFTSDATLMPMLRSTSSERGELESALSFTPGELDLFSVMALCLVKQRSQPSRERCRNVCSSQIATETLALARQHCSQTSCRRVAMTRCRLN